MVNLAAPPGHKKEAPRRLRRLVPLAWEGKRDPTMRVRQTLVRPPPASAGEGRPRDYFWMQVSAVSLVHSSRPVNTGSSTFLPSINWIITVGAL